MNISDAMGYSHGRRLQRMTQDPAIRNTNRTEVGLGAAALFGLLLPIIFIFLIFDLG